MHNKFRKILACILCLAVMLPAGSLAVYSDDEAPAEETAAEETADAADDLASDDSDDVDKITDEQAFEKMQLVCENDSLALYRSTDNKSTQICLLNKASGKMWWANPVNASKSKAKKAQKNELMSGMTMTYAEPASRRTTNVNSKGKGKAEISDIANGLRIVYTYEDCGITIPVQITLEEDHLKLYVNSSEIKEAYSSPTAGMLTQVLSFMTTFGAADNDAEGYFVIPDGEGAIINFNNKKTGYRVYSSKVYGADPTPVKQTKSYTTQNVMLNMFGIVEGSDGLVVVADKGDSAASINAYVAGENNTDYNGCYFSFEMRTTDEYLMGGDSNPLKVFEKRGILVPEIELRYYPVSTDDGSPADYVDIAEKYRDYLTSSCGVAQSPKAASNPLFVNFYGATLKRESILGIPVTIQKKVTGFDDAQNIMSSLVGSGVNDMIVNYKDWTSTDIGEKITDSASPAASLGGSGKFKKMMNYASSNNIMVYPDTDNFTFRSSLSYPTVTNTSIRVSNSYSRQVIYDLAHGVENKYYKSLSLFSPSAYEKAFGKLVKSYGKNKNISGISLGSLANKICGDYGKKAVSREMAMGYAENIYSDAKSTVGSVLADTASKYTLPYVDCVSNIPLSSSKFDLFDEEIPFYQIVLHGLIPYSTTAVNGDADVSELVLKAIASGSNMRFDLIAEEASELKDTKYDIYYYAYYKNWIDDAAGCYRLQNDILSEVSLRTIVEYNVSEDGNEIETVYDDNTRTVVNFENKTVKLNGTTYKLSDYLSGGVIGE